MNYHLIESLLIEQTLAQSYEKVQEVITKSYENHLEIHGLIMNELVLFTSNHKLILQLSHSSQLTRVTRSSTHVTIIVIQQHLSFRCNGSSH